MAAKAPTVGWVLISLVVMTSVQISAAQQVSTSTEVSIPSQVGDQEQPPPKIIRPIKTENVSEADLRLLDSQTTELAVINETRNFDRNRDIRNTAKERIEDVANEVIKDMTDKLLNKVMARLRQSRRKSTSESVGWTLAALAILSTLGVAWALCKRPRRNQMEDLEANLGNILLPYDSQQSDTTYRPNDEDDDDLDFTELSETTQYPNSSATPSRNRLTLSRLSSPEILRKDVATAMTPQTGELLEVRPPTKTPDMVPETVQLDTQDQEEGGDDSRMEEVQDEESDDNFTQNFANSTAELSLSAIGSTGPSTSLFTHASGSASPALTFYTARSNTSTPTSNRRQVTQMDGNETRAIGSISTPLASQTLLSPDLFESYQQRRPQLERQNAMTGGSTGSSGSSGFFSLAQPINFTIRLKKLFFRDARDTPDPRTGQLLVRGGQPKFELKLVSPRSESTIQSLGSSPILKQPKRPLPSVESTPIVKRDPKPRRVRFNPEVDCPHLSPCGDRTFCVRKSTENSRKKGKKFVEARERRQSGDGPPKSDYY